MTQGTGKGPTMGEQDRKATDPVELNDEPEEEELGEVVGGWADRDRWDMANEQGYATQWKRDGSPGTFDEYLRNRFEGTSFAGLLRAREAWVADGSQNGRAGYYCEGKTWCQEG